MDFYRWALEMNLKVIGVDCGSAEHPMNTAIRRMHESHFRRAEATLQRETGKTWDEVFPPGEYYELTHLTMPKAHLLFCEAIVGEIDKLKSERAWIAIMPIPYMEVETAWARVAAYEPPPGMGEAEFFQALDDAELFDLTAPLSVQTPQWLNYVPLSVTFTKRVGGQFFGMGRNGSICNASIHLGSHMDGETHFYPGGRTIGQVPRSIAFGIKHHPEFVKVNRAKWEATIKTLPKQVAPYVMLRHHTITGSRDGLREAALLAKAWGMTSEWIVLGITGTAMYFTGFEGLYAAADAVDDLL